MLWLVGGCLWQQSLHLWWLSGDFYWPWRFYPSFWSCFVWDLNNLWMSAWWKRMSSFHGHTWSGDLDPFSRSEEFEMRWKLVSYLFHVFIVATLNTWCTCFWLWFSRMTCGNFSDIMSKLSAHCTLCWFWFYRMMWWSSVNTFCTPCWFWFPTRT